MERTGLFTWNSEFMDGWKEAFGIAHHDAGSWDDVLDAICHVGHAGEMFTSAAPYDPMFWPLHGIADRFLMLKRLRYYEKSTELEETWGYDHALVNVASDTHLVCDWDRVDQVRVARAARRCARRRRDSSRRTWSSDALRDADTRGDDCVRHAEEKEHSSRRRVHHDGDAVV